ncbi:MAG: sigma 54-interacting transcriptional regulator [Polyangiaceae bacterium]
MAARKGDDDHTVGLEDSGRASALRGFRLTIVEGQDVGTTHEFHERAVVGSQQNVDVLLQDRTVSRYHCEIVASPEGYRVRDLGSTNGTVLDGVRVEEAWLRGASVVSVGGTRLRFDVAGEAQPLALSSRSAFGSLVGSSVAMRSCFALLERVAETDSTVLLEGETGCGKDAAAEALHQLGARKERPLVVVDCGAAHGNLLESQLFGHERGAFTGADARRSGAFEEAQGGTIFLDEIGELPLELQPKLLRVLEHKQIQRVGSNVTHRVDARIIAATNRDLRAEVNKGNFRADLYFRLAVVRIRLPSLREHAEDIPLLARRLLEGLGASRSTIDELLDFDFVAHLQRTSWPGNVRELRNHLERCLVFQSALPPAQDERPRNVSAAPRVDLPFDQARREVLDAFERSYLEAQLERHANSTTKAAAAAGVGRVYFYKLLKRHGLR